MGALSTNEKEARFSAGFLTETGFKATSKGYFGSVEQAGLACWIIAERIDAIEAKDSARIAVEQICADFTLAPSLAKTKIKEYLLNTHQRLKDESKIEKLKASLVMVITDYSKIVWAVVGNVRLYHFRGGEFNFRSKDQTIAQLMLDSGLLAEDDVNHREERNNLINNLGGISEFKPFVSEPFRMQDGDVLLLCNSGVWEKMKNNEIAEVLAQSGDPDDFLAKLKTAVLAQGDPGAKGYTMGAIFAQQVGDTATGLNCWKLIPKKLQKPLLRPADSHVKTAIPVDAPSRQNTVLEEVSDDSDSISPEEPKTPNVKEEGVVIPLQFGVDDPQDPNIQAKVPDLIEKSASQAVVTESQDTSKVLKFTVKNTKVELTEPQLLLPRLRALWAKITDPLKRLPNLHTLSRRLKRLWSQISTRPLLVDEPKDVRKLGIYGLIVIIIVGFGWLYTQQVAAMKAQKALEVQRQITISQQRTLVDHERSGDQMASSGQYQLASREYQAALRVLQQLCDPARQAIITQKMEIAEQIIAGDNYIVAGKYDAALEAYSKANPIAAGIDCLQNGLTPKIAWTQQMITLLNLENIGDQEMNRKNFILAREQYQSALIIANQLFNSEQIKLLTEKLANVGQVISEITHDAEIASQHEAKSPEREKSGRKLRKTN